MWITNCDNLDPVLEFLSEYVSISVFPRSLFGRWVCRGACLHGRFRCVWSTYPSKLPGQNSVHLCLSIYMSASLNVRLPGNGPIKTLWRTEKNSYWTIVLQSLSFSCAGVLMVLPFFFSLAVNDAMAAAHSGSSQVTSLSNNPPSIRITSGVTCTVLSNNERLFAFIREGSCCSRFERSNRSKYIGSFLDKISISAVFCTGNSGCPGLDVLIYPIISSREVFRKSLCLKTRILPWFPPAYVRIFCKFNLSCWGCQHPGACQATCAQLSCGIHPTWLSNDQCNSGPSSTFSTRISLNYPLANWSEHS